jgi:hypothetical protein
MGYPMTYRRVLNRNGLADGDYDKLPQSKAHLFSGDLTFETLKRIQEMERLFRAISGDLRRLEKDSVDEKAICLLIAEKTGLAPDTVAGVIKEFLAT